MRFARVAMAGNARSATSRYRFSSASLVALPWVVASRRIDGYVKTMAKETKDGSHEGA